MDGVRSGRTSEEAVAGGQVPDDGGPDKTCDSGGGEK